MQIRNVHRSDNTLLHPGDTLGTSPRVSVPLRRARSSGDLQALGLRTRGAPSSAPPALPAIGIAASHAAQKALISAAALETELHFTRTTGATDNSLAPRLAARLMDVAIRIAEHCAAVPPAGQPHAPMPEAWRCLEVLASLRRKLNPAQLMRARDMLSKAAEASPHSPADKALLLDTLNTVTQADGPGLGEYVAKRAYEGLCLNQLQLKADGEAEPPARTFNSILPSLAASTYDYNPLGRTLLWEGACRLFDGPSAERRRAALQTAVFSLPNVPAPGEQPLGHLVEFILAIDDMALYETNAAGASRSA
ncbi:type III effector protein [Ralstonia solanacearum]|uniref:type III effector protein n=1 Tax=Ralstonia solanacearum TaxID=305 RepID=UPI00168A8613|nr:type III effector protein [Ralstonia solanacearum]AYB51171.2 type III effector protein [Ralstonia solanacearum]AYB55721.2 type III effector protein [Ralstonia solanacearum]